MEIATDCSWILKKVLSFRTLARRFLTFTIGNGNNTSLWFDPWWNNTCLASKVDDPIISQAYSNKLATVNTLILSGRWILPRPNPRRHHLSNVLQSWLHDFVPPTFDLDKRDDTLWNDTPIRKITTSHIWDAIRFKLPEVPWHHLIWHKLKVTRYAHHAWLICLNRLPTFNRLLAFGLNVSPHCLLCVGGLENRDHLFASCAFSRFVLQALATRLHLSVPSTWMNLITNWGAHPSEGHRGIALLTTQVFAYHIWRERTVRLHNKGCFGPSKIIDGILVDVKTRLASSVWFVKNANTEYFLSWLR
ncbi:hypothetical protein POM88_013865 [Heracleum sosnowskyi]|uniref:Reverse transcriptase zinc-binding domain-containing protein n=1 Tax=Heracleum sosnowskyi TaxID=360622 RepID=A0AAD8IZD4_9APIA|nr:hypothetical protein POM88_013865 [Heracleum sosnowskyi]